MDHILSTLCSTAGVSGAALLDERGNCIAEALDPPYEPILLTELFPYLEASEDVFSVVEGYEPLEGLIINFTYGSLVVRRFSDLHLLVIADRQVNQASLGVALNVATLKLKRFIGGGSRSSFSQSSGQQFVPASQGNGASSFDASAAFSSTLDKVPAESKPAFNKEEARPQPPSFGSVSGSFGSVSGSFRKSASNRTSGAFNSSANAQKTTVSVAAIRHLIRTLNQYTRRDGRELLDRELSRYDASPSTLPLEHFDDFLTDLARHIPGRLRERFILEAKQKR